MAYSSVQYDDDDCPLIGSEDVEELDDENQIHKTNVFFSSAQIPKDRFKFVYLTFTLLGISSLLPFTFFMTASDYWMYKFRNISDVYPSQNFEEKTHLQTVFQGYFGISANVPALFMFICNTYFIKRFSQEMRNSLSLLTIILFFGATLTFVKLDTDSWQKAFFQLTMTTVVVINAAGAVFQGSLVDLAANFPPCIMSSLVSGQGIAGVLPALAEIFSLLGDIPPTTSALIYFVFGLFILFVSFSCYIGIHKSNFFKFYMTKSEVCRQMEPVLQRSFGSNYSSTFKMLWPYIISIFIVFFATMVVTPGLATLAVSLEANTDILLTSRLYLPVTCFLIFSVGDICGRFCSSSLALVICGPISILVLSCIRLLFIPLFMLCNLHPRTHLPVVFTSDAYYITFMALFGLTNGFCFGSAMLLGSKEAPSRWKNEISVLLSLALGMGLLVGAFTSIGLIKVL